MKMQWPSPHQSPITSQHRPPRQDRRAVHPQSLYSIYLVLLPGIQFRVLLCDFPLHHPHSPEILRAPDHRGPCAHQARSTRHVDATRIRARPRGPVDSTCNALMLADPRHSPLSRSSSPPTFRPSTRRYSRRVAGAHSRSVAPCTAHAVRRIPHPCSQNPPSHHASSLRSTNHHKRSSRRERLPHWRGSRSASQAAVGGPAWPSSHGSQH